MPAPRVHPQSQVTHPPNACLLGKLPSLLLLGCPGVCPATKDTVNQSEVNCVCPCLRSLSASFRLSNLKEEPTHPLCESLPSLPFPRVNQSLRHCRLFFRRWCCLAYLMRRQRALPREPCVLGQFAQPPAWEEIKCINHCGLRRKPSANVKVCANAGVMATVPHGLVRERRQYKLRNHK